MIDFSEAQLDDFLADDPGGPVVMLNLLRFRPDGGRESYYAYLQAVAGLTQTFGAEVVYAGDGSAPLVAEPGQEWDTVAVVRYPSRQSFVDMVRHPEYQANKHYRTDALVEAVLQPTASL